MPFGAYAGPFGMVPFHRIYRTPRLHLVPLPGPLGPSGPVGGCVGGPDFGDVDRGPGYGERFIIDRGNL